MIHPAITHCDNCGCDWLDNGLNPIGCPYCKQHAQVAEIKTLLVEVDELLDALRQIAEWPDGGNRYGQENIKRFARHTIDAALAAYRKGDKQ